MAGMGGGCRGRPEARSGTRVGRNRSGDDGGAKPLTRLCMPRSTCGIIEQPMKLQLDADLVPVYPGPGMTHPTMTRIS